MIILGLTGSIATGKSNVASHLKAQNIPVFDADKAAHYLIENDAKSVLKEQFPHAVIDGDIDRKKLGDAIFGDDTQTRILENILHPLIADKRDLFLAEHKKKGTPLVVLDIPLLYECRLDRLCDYTMVTTTDPNTQKQRALRRPHMTEEKFANIISRQIPDAQKCEKADFVIDTTGDKEETRALVDQAIASVRKKHA